MHCSSKKFERMALQAINVCLRVLKESNNRRFDSNRVRKSVLIVSYITFWDCRVHIFSDNLIRNSCILRSGASLPTVFILPLFKWRLSFMVAAWYTLYPTKFNKKQSQCCLWSKIMAKCKALKGVLNINEKSYVLLERSNNFILFLGYLCMLLVNNFFKTLLI